jgi:hypothetical protein
MKMFVLSVLIIVGALFWSKDFVQSGKLEKFLDTHPNPAFNQKIEYIWGMALHMAGRNAGAMYRIQRAAEKYKVPGAADALAEYIQLLDDSHQRDKMMEQSAVFLEKYPNHDKAETIRRKIDYIRQSS